MLHKSATKRYIFVYNIITIQQIQLRAKINVKVISAFSRKGVLNIDPGTMADYMMEAIADFSRRNKTTSEGRHIPERHGANLLATNGKGLKTRKQLL